MNISLSTSQLRALRFAKYSAYHEKTMKPARLFDRIGESSPGPMLARMHDRTDCLMHRRYVKGDCYYYWISPAGLKVLDEIDG